MTDRNETGHLDLPLEAFRDDNCLALLHRLTNELPEPARPAFEAQIRNQQTMAGSRLGETSGTDEHTGRTERSER